MMTAHPYAALPDPVSQAAFYDGVTLKRLIAWVFDVILIFGITVAVSILTFGIGFFVFIGLYALISFLYRTFTLSGGSATWGMRLMSMELRTHRGERLDLLTAFLHTLAFTVSFGMILVQAVSVVMMMTTARGQGLSDLVLGTVAINRVSRF